MDDCLRLSPQQRRNLAAAAERIIPSGDGPGAAETGAAAYVESALGEVLGSAARRRFAHGLDLLSEMAQVLGGREFADCTLEQQDATLEQLGRVPHRLTQRFLRLLVELTLQGYLCDPRHGGNRDGLGWSYIGFRPDRATEDADDEQCT